jgi:cytidylate kinase
MAVITLSREMGSEGEFVGAEVAKRLGLPFADREVIEEAAKRAGLPQEILDAKEQEANTQVFSSSDMAGLVRRSQSGRRQQMEDSYYVKFMGEAIAQMASRPAVILGRGAQFLLQGRSDILHVYVYAPLAVRISRVMRERSLSREQAERAVRASDQERAGYIKRYFNNANWRNPDYYNLMIDTSRVSPQTAVDLVVRAAEALSAESFAPNAI